MSKLMITFHLTNSNRTANQTESQIIFTLIKTTHPIKQAPIHIKKRLMKIEMTYLKLKKEQAPVVLLMQTWQK